MQRVARSAVMMLVLLVGAMSGSAGAQVQVTSNDIQRLQDTVFSLGSELRQVRSRDPQLATDLESTLDELRDEVTYLKVRLRKERSVSRSEYTDLRDRLDDLRSRIHGNARSSSSTRDVSSADTRTSEPMPSERSTTTRQERRSTRSTNDTVIPVGQEIDVRLQDTLSSDRNQVEDRFIATTVVDLQIDERVVIPAGSELRGVISSVKRAGRVERKGEMTVTFDELTVNGRNYPIRGTVTQALESSGVRGEAAKIGTGAGVGAIIGGILGGFKGALAGILIGGGGVIAATEGNDVELPAGTILRVSLDSPPDIR